jgi:hypothetical protein
MYNFARSKISLFMLQWTFHPFILQTKRFYTVLIWRRVLAFLCVSVSELGALLYVIWWYLLFHLVTYTSVSMSIVPSGFSILADSDVLFYTTSRAKLSLP